MSSLHSHVLLCLIFLLLAACRQQTPLALPAGASVSEPLPQTEIVEQPVSEIPLKGPLSRRRAQFSGLAWYGDALILLPQYPERFQYQLFYLEKQEIIASIQGDIPEPLRPQPIPLVVGDLLTQIAGFQGFEAIAIDGERVYMTIEAGSGAQMMGYLVTGIMARDLSEIRLEPDRLATIHPQSPLPNLSDEAVFVAEGQVVTLYEVNTLLVNFAPVAHRFDAESLQPLDVIPFPHIDYRITDATALDGENRFWAINNFSLPNNPILLGQEALAAKYGVGTTHQEGLSVERLVAFQYTPTAITLVDSPPIQLQLHANTPRNWEGIARLDAPDINGFLLVTDSRPATMLAFVPLPR